MPSPSQTRLCLSSLLLLTLLLGSLCANELNLRVVPFLRNERLPNSFPEHLSKGESLLLQLTLTQALLKGEPQFPNLPEAFTISKPANYEAEQTSRQRIYLLTALEAGNFPLGELHAPTDRGTRKLALPEIQVREEFAGQPMPLGEEKLFFTLSSNQSQAYPREQFLADATLYLPLGIHERSLNYTMPTITGSQVMSTPPNYGRPSPRSRMIDGALYYSIAFPLQLTLLDEQATEIGPAQLTLDFAHTSREGPSFAPEQRTRRYTGVPLETATLPLQALPLPADAPPSFRGAVGDYQLELRNIQPRTPRFGDPFYLEFSATGSGNFDLLPNPVAVAEHAWDIEVISANTTEINPSRNQDPPPAFNQKKRDYLLLLRPKLELPAENLPELGLSFFNPQSQQYQTSSLRFPPLPEDYFLLAQETTNTLLNAPPSNPLPQQPSATTPPSPLLSPAVNSTPLRLPSLAQLSQNQVNQVHLIGAGALTLFLLTGLLWRAHWHSKHSPQARLLSPLRRAQKAHSKNPSKQTLQQLSEALRQLQLKLEHQLPRQKNQGKNPTETLQQKLHQTQQKLEHALYQAHFSTEKLKQQNQLQAEIKRLIQLTQQNLSSSKPPPSPPSPKPRSRAKTSLLSALTLLISLPLLLSAELKAQESSAEAQNPQSQNQNPSTEATPTTQTFQTSPNQLKTTSPETIADLARQAYQAQNWSLAYQLWTELGQQQGYNPALCTHLGNASYELNRHAESSLWFRRALLQEPFQKEATNNLSLAQAKLSLPDSDLRLLQRERWLHHLNPLLQTTARISWWLAAALLVTPLLWKRRGRAPWWIAASACLLLCLGSLVLARGQTSHGSTQERFVLLEAAPLRSAPLRDSALIQNLPAGQSCRTLSQRGAWLFVEYPRPDYPRYPQRGWLRQETGQALWPPPANPQS